jgi:hypothetical protein
MNRKKSKRKNEVATTPESRPASPLQPSLPPKASAPLPMNARPKPSRAQKVWSKITAVVKTSLIVLVVLSPFITYISCYRWSLKPAQFTVDRRERVVKGSGDSTQSYYLVWSREGEVFTVNDSWSFLSWNSSDRYGKLHEGSKIKAQVAGWRVPFLSWYRNVIVIESVDDQ